MHTVGKAYREATTKHFHHKLWKEYGLLEYIHASILDMYVYCISAILNVGIAQK